MATQKDFRLDPNSNLTFKDLSDEQYRVYIYPDMEIRINEPLFLNVSASGGHRIFDSEGKSNYIPSGWRKLYCVVKEGKPHFAF